ncbi:MAG: DUF5329 domain-containing protein [Proteobacteria bacterium]|nr:DUF5329 domain-containing protein [Pseudomonadota bacterium]
MNTRIMSALFILALFILTPLLSVADEACQKEINHLLSFVGSTGCQFERNGVLYTGTEAVKHIRKKYDYFKNKISTAEQFIEYCATGSTVSGMKYHVICRDNNSSESGKWLMEELLLYRQISTVKCIPTSK